MAQLEGQTAVVTGGASVVVADVALFLASEQSSFVNGEAILVNGGTTHTA